jgi:hypothetical protein
VSGSRIVGVIANFNNTGFWLASTQIGKFDPTILEGLLYLVEDAIVHDINGFLKMGFPVPVLDGLSLVNPTIGIYWESMQSANLLQ